MNQNISGSLFSQKELRNLKLQNFSRAITFRINSSTEQIYHEGVNCDISIYHCFSLIYICKCVKVRSNCQIREMAAKILQQIGLSSIHGVGNPQGNSLYMTLYYRCQRELPNCLIYDFVQFRILINKSRV